MFSYLKDNKKLVARNEKLESENEQLLDDRRSLKKDLADLESLKSAQVEKLKLDRKIADEDIKHMQKIQSEKLEIAHQKEKARIQMEADKKVLDNELVHAKELRQEIDRSRQDANELVKTLTEGLTKSLGGKFKHG